MLVPLKIDDKIVDTVEFHDNLTLENVPDYVNFNFRIGITRLNAGKYRGKLVVMFYSELYEHTSYASLVSEEEGYLICLKRGKLDVAEVLGINPEFEEEIII